MDRPHYPSPSIALALSIRAVDAASATASTAASTAASAAVSTVASATRASALFLFFMQSFDVV